MIQSIDSIPEEEQVQEIEVEKTKAHVVGTIALSEDGVWHLSYVGYYVHPRTRKPAFGNWTESGRNLNKVLRLVQTRLENGHKTYMAQIALSKEVKNEPSNDVKEPSNGDID